MSENKMAVNNSIDRNSRVHAAQINLFKYFIFATLCSVVPLSVFCDFNAILDINFTIIYCVIILVFISMLVPVKIRFVFRYISPFLILVFVSKFFKNGTYSKTSYFCNICELYKNITLLLVPAFSILTVHNVRSVFSMLVILFRRWSFQFSKVRIIGYIAMCIVNAVILSYLLYLVMFLVIYGWFHILVRTDLDSSTISVEVNDILRNEDCVLPPLRSFERTVSWQIYRNNNSTSRQSAGVDATFNGKKLPVCRKIYYRVVGEDVDINCHIDNTDGSVILKEVNINRIINFRNFENLEWDLGRRLSINSYKLPNVELMPSSKSNITLRITDLTAENFKEEITLWGISKFKDITLKVKIGSFFINKQKEMLKSIHVPEGHILSLNSLAFYSFSTTDDHLVVHNITSIVEDNISGNTNAVCSDIFQGCGPMINVLFNMSKVGNIFNKEPWTKDMMLNSYQVAASLIETGIQIAKSFTCVCETSYGQHTYSILRPLFNHSSNQTYISEIILPYRFLILPRGLTHFA